MPVILATWEAEIRKIAVRDQPGQKSSWDSIPTEKSWMWWCTPVIPATVGSIKQTDDGQAHLDKKQDPNSKTARAQKG
jgi:hypothetical protein